MQLAQGIQVRSMIIHNRIIKLSQDRKSPQLIENTKGIELFITSDEINVFVEALGSMVGTTWSLTIWIEGNLLTPNPIEQEVKANGNASLNKKFKWS